MNTLLLPAIIASSLVFAAPAEPATFAVWSGDFELQHDTISGGQPSQLIYHSSSGPVPMLKVGSGMGDSGFMPKLGVPQIHTPQMSCSIDMGGGWVLGELIEHSDNYIHTWCQSPRNWTAHYDTNTYGLDLSMQWITEAISGGFRMRVALTNHDIQPVQFWTSGGRWGLVPQVHLVDAALLPDRAWYLDASTTWRQFSIASITGYGFLDVPADWSTDRPWSDWMQSAGHGFGVSQGNFGVAVIAPWSPGFALKHMLDPAGDGSVQNLTFIAPIAPVEQLGPGQTIWTGWTYVLVGKLSDIQSATKRATQ